VGVLVGLLSSVVLGGAGAAAYFAVGMGPDHTALSAIEQNETLTVDRVDGMAVVRSGPITANTTGLIYYPGARVAHESYVPTAAEIVADRDIAVVIVDMPLNLAVLSTNRADKPRTEYPIIESWYVGGHSLGGAMACRYAAANPAALDGLVLHGSYCDQNISNTDLRVLSVLGENDGVIDAEQERTNRELLPPDATIVELEGVNHAGFGAYGPQRGDTPAPREPAAMRVDVGRTTGSWIVDTQQTQVDHQSEVESHRTIAFDNWV